LIQVAGEALVDVFPDGSVRPGGSPFNLAIGLARLGSRVALATRISGDARGGLLRAALEREGVDTRFCRPSSSATPTAHVSLSASGAPSYRFEGLDDLDLRFAAPLDAVSCLHTGSYALVSRRSSAALLASFAAAPRDVLLSVDPNVRPAMEPSVELWRAAVAGFAARANLLKVSEEDVRMLAGADADVDAIAAGWLSDRCALVALTRGEGGATLFSRRHGRVDAAACPVDVVDSVGAGDAFQAALLGGLSERGALSAPALDRMSAEPLRALLAMAVKASALACTRQGADPPTRSQLIAAVV
jgi:fructokinase